MKIEGVRGELYFHVLNKKRKLSYGDGREVLPGKELKAKMQGRKIPTLCDRGMHASKECRDAFVYAYPFPGRWVCIVRLSQNVRHSENSKIHFRDTQKSVAVRRAVVAMRQIDHSLPWPYYAPQSSKEVYDWVMAKPWKPGDKEL